MSSELPNEESPVRITVQRQGSHFEVENMDKLELDVETPSGSSCSPGDVYSTELHRPNKDTGFGFKIEGGSDRPYLDIDSGIYITHITEGSVTHRDGQIEIGDKILEINDKPIIYEKHNDVVNMIKSCHKSVKLTLHKSAGLLLRSATLTEESADSGRSSPMQSHRNQKVNKDQPNFSMSGFFVGLTIGCIAVFAMRKLMTTKS